MSDRRIPLANVRKLTQRTLSKTFDISPMTIHNWRRGSSETSPLPVQIVNYKNARRVYVLETDLKMWLQLNRPELYERWAANDYRLDTA